MKKLIVLMSACLLISLMGYTQKITPDKVPAAVKQAFAKKFPGVTNVSYEMEKKDFEINFKDKGVEMSANFDAKGNWLETETGIKASDLPEAVSASVSKNFAGFKTTEIAKVEKRDSGLIYEMDLNNGKEGYEVQFSPNGVILKKTPLKKEKSKDEKD